jgi:polysaccharide export outer membrane protein
MLTYNLLVTNCYRWKLLGLLFIFSSCASYKHIPYFQDVNRSKITSEALNFTSPIIQPEDQLSINISSLTPETSVIFDNNIQVNVNNTGSPIFGYFVNQNGEITLPLIKTLKVSGMTTTQLSEVLVKKLVVSLKEPTVTVRILNFKVSVLGDVMRPNVYTVNAERITITDALSLAGDLNITADRQNVLLVTERDGVKEFIPIDLTSKEIFKSSYYYLANNDLIYVQPARLKVSTIETQGSRNAALFVSAITAMITLAYLVFHK